MFRLGLLAYLASTGSTGTHNYLMFLLSLRMEDSGHDIRRVLLVKTSREKFWLLKDLADSHLVDRSLIKYNI